ncbi:MAG: signal peptidase II [Calditrichaeota bacterium]|nr:signal peptidase II [Calditrichota bacterium]
MKKNFTIFHTITIILTLLGLDQLTKYITKTNMMLGESIHIIDNFFRLTYVENPGMAFGLRIENTTLFMGLSLIAAGLVFYYLYILRNEVWQLQFAIAMIASGAIGNLSDRFIRGSVVDFLDFEFFDVAIPAFNFLGFEFSGYYMTRWPVFNVADMAVSGGMILIFGYILLKGDPLNKSVKEPTETTPHAG